jgi:hypothetical protein
MPLGELRWVRLDLMPAAPGQNDLQQHHLDEPSVIDGLGFRRRQERMGLGAVPAAARCHASRPLAQTPSAVKRAALAVSGRAWREFASNCERTPTTGGDLGRCCGSEVLRERASPHWRGRAPCFELVVERRINLKPWRHPELDPLAEQKGSTMEDWAHLVSLAELPPRQRSFRRRGPRSANRIRYQCRGARRRPHRERSFSGSHRTSSLPPLLPQRSGRLQPSRRGHRISRNAKGQFRAATIKTG